MFLASPNRIGLPHLGFDRGNPLARVLRSLQHDAVS
jgi:hypothetical protein